eukprot:2372-Eustigmatos_ZCMA.PRE.1
MDAGAVLPRVSEKDEMQVALRKKCDVSPQAAHPTEQPDTVKMTKAKFHSLYATSTEPSS